MKKRRVYQMGFLPVLLLVLLALPQMVSAQSAQFVYGRGDILAGFRKTGLNQANFELVVNVGNITNFGALSPGATITITNFSSNSLASAFADFNNLQWSVTAAFALPTSLGPYPGYSVWYTLPRTDVNAQTLPPDRGTQGYQGSLRQRIISIGSGATTISSGLSGPNEYNNPVLVREPAGNSSGYTAQIGGDFDPTTANFHELLPTTVENTTPSAFNSPAICDFYQLIPDGKIDPDTGLTNGMAYLLGTFKLNPDGSMSFTRTSTTVAPPPAPTLSVAPSGNNVTISFATTNGANYTLYFTNAAGLTAPVASWPSSPTTVTGDGSVKSFTDTITDAVRFYRVGAQ